MWRMWLAPLQIPKQENHWSRFGDDFEDRDCDTVLTAKASLVKVPLFSYKKPTYSLRDHAAGYK